MIKLIALVTLLAGITTTSQAGCLQLASYGGSYQAPGTAMDIIQSGLNTEPEQSVDGTYPLIQNSQGNPVGEINPDIENKDIIHPNQETPENGPPNNDVRSTGVSSPPAQAL